MSASVESIEASIGQSVNQQFVTKIFHHEPYAAISPTRPELSTKGKHVVITGAGTGIGAAIALSFAQSGASSIALLGRTEATLLQTKTTVSATYPETAVHIITADVANEASIRAALEKYASSAGKKLDILVANAGVFPDHGTLLETDASLWWSGFEVNVRGQFNLVRAFVPLAEKKATVINVTTSVAQFPFVPGSSAYHGSKLAGTKLFDYLHFENPELRVLQFHPGVVQTSMSQKSFDSGIPRQYAKNSISARRICGLVCECRFGESPRQVSVGELGR